MTEQCSASTRGKSNNQHCDLHEQLVAVMCTSSCQAQVFKLAGCLKHNRICCIWLACFNMLVYFDQLMLTSFQVAQETAPSLITHGRLDPGQLENKTAATTEQLNTSSERNVKSG